jgi:hypothetical protein
MWDTPTLHSGGPCMLALRAARAALLKALLADL